MAYKALYRKYRPSNFDEVVGQQHVVMTLRNAIKNNKLAHAYLFCGPRGTGKTTIAKLLAKAINCEGEGVKPCGKCASCIDIQESTHPDVVELDAATNNGVEEIRDLIDRVKYAPLRGKYKVYIIDEVHMMTASAFNALLKTLEEPPEYCIFIMATTEPQKVLPTIISRCQRFDFTKVPVQLIIQRLRFVAENEKINIDDDALGLIAEIADGGMRDALSILDQCIAYAQNDIKLSDVNAVYGITTTAEKIALLNDIKDKDMTKMIASLNDIAAKGIDIPRLTMDMLNLCKEAVIYAYAHNGELLNKLTAQQAEELNEGFTTPRLLRYIDYLMDAAGKYRGSTDSLSYLEVCLLKMMADEKQPDGATRQEPAAAPQPVQAPSQPQPKPEPEAAPKPEPIPVRSIKRLTDDQIYMMLTRSTKACKEKDAPLWDQLVNSTDPLSELLRQGTVMADSPQDLIISVDTRQVADDINDDRTMAPLEKLVENIYGNHKEVIAVTREEASYLITYFRQRQSQQAGPAEDQPSSPEAAEAADTDEPQGMEKLFGANGFETRKD